MIVAGWEIGTEVRHAAGHDRGGDRAVVSEHDGSLVLGVIDVLGHGADADCVACIAEETLGRSGALSADALLRVLDAELSGTIGAAAGIVTVQPGAKSGLFAGVGNTVVKIIGRSSRTLVSSDGIVGQRATVPTATSVAVQDGEVLLMHSDGISSRIDWREYPEVAEIDPALAAREIVRKFGRSHDDVSCIIARPPR